MGKLPFSLYHAGRGRKLRGENHLSLPTGVALSVSTTSGDTDEIDLSGVPDEELEQLASYFTTFSTGYVQTASDVSAGDFFHHLCHIRGGVSGFVAGGRFLGSKRQYKWKRNLDQGELQPHPFHLPGKFTGSGGWVLEQLSLFNEEFVGRVLLAKNPSDSGNAISVFIGETAWQVLQAASQEIEQR